MLFHTIRFLNRKQDIPAGGGNNLKDAHPITRMCVSIHILEQDLKEANTNIYFSKLHLFTLTLHPKATSNLEAMWVLEPRDTGFKSSLCGNLGQAGNIPAFSCS